MYTIRNVDLVLDDFYEKLGNLKAVNYYINDVFINLLFVKLYYQHISSQRIACRTNCT